MGSAAASWECWDTGSILALQSGLRIRPCGSRSLDYRYCPDLIPGERIPYASGQPKKTKQQKTKNPKTLSSFTIKIELSLILVFALKGLRTSLEETIDNQQMKGQVYEVSAIFCNVNTDDRYQQPRRVGD